MLKVIKYFLLTFLLVLSVAKFAPVNHTDKELQTYVDNYMFFVDNFCTKDQYWYPSRARIYLTKLEGETIGTCAYMYPRTFDIMIDETFFNAAEPLQRFQLIAHEMRHCLFLVDHKQDPHNYMAPYFVKLTKDELYKQIAQDLEESCKR